MCLYIDPEILQSKPRSQTMSLARSMSVEVLLNDERQTLPVTGEVSINPYADWMRNYISTQSPYTCTSGNALPMKELLQKGEFQSKPRDPFPYPTLDVGDFRLNVIGEDKNIITYIHNGIKYDPKGKESCGYSIVFIPAGKESGLEKNLLVYFYNKCGLSNMGCEHFEYPGLFYGKKYTFKAHCREALFKSASSLYAGNPLKVLTAIYGAKSVPDLKRASREATDFNSDEWNNDSWGVMLKAVLLSARDMNGYTFRVFLHLILAGEHLKALCGDNDKPTELCILESPEFEDPIWGCGLNREDAVKKLEELLLSGKGNEISGMFNKNPLNATRKLSEINCFGDAQNKMGICLTIVARAIQACVKEFDLSCYDPSFGMKVHGKFMNILKQMDLTVIKFGFEEGDERNASVLNSISFTKETFRAKDVLAKLTTFECVAAHAYAGWGKNHRIMMGGIYNEAIRYVDIGLNRLMENSVVLTDVPGEPRGFSTDLKEMQNILRLFRKGLYSLEKVRDDSNVMGMLDEDSIVKFMEMEKTLKTLCNKIHYVIFRMEKEKYEQPSPYSGEEEAMAEAGAAQDPEDVPGDLEDMGV